MITALIVLGLLVMIGWSGWRARSFGKLGIYSWLQSGMLLLPWLVFFALGSAGIYLNLAGSLLLFVASTGAYVFLGRQVRVIAPEELAKRAEAIIKAREAVNGADIPADAATDGTPNLPIATPTEPGEIVPIPSEDLTLIRSIFGIDTFFATEAIPFQDGAVFNGNLRGDLEPTFEKLTTRLTEKVGDRYRLFLIENQEGRPTIVVLPSSNDPKPMTLSQKILAVVLAVGTVATCLETAGILQGFDFYTSPQRYAEVVPMGLGVVAVLVVHELGHWITAERYDVKLSWPLLFPTWQIGSFGALTRFESILPNRNVLFDIAFAGPAAGGVLSLGMLILGLVLSNANSQFKVPTEFFESSILVGTLARVILGAAVKEPIVAVSPLVVLGWLGLVITAINVMPAGQLDGGRIMQAIYGRKVASRASIATFIVLGIVSLVNQLAFYWAIVILFLQRGLERPSLNELTEPDDTRAALALLALFLMVTVLLPLTPSLAGRLGFPV
jgi:membrane-associated protease RseP (regulator of RpoE activity)